MIGRPLPSWAYGALVGALAFVVYIPSLGNGFALDDVPAVAQDERIRDVGNIGRLLTEPYLTYMPVERSPYRPVTTASYVVSWAIGGGHPAGFHAVNVAAHVAAVLMLLSVLLALGAPRLPACLATAVFAVHPVHVEAVAGVVGRADVLATLLCVAALRVYLLDALAPSVRAAATSALYLLALGAKEGAIVLPLLLLLTEVARGMLRRSSGTPAPSDASGGTTRAWPTYAALAAALAFFLLVRRAVLGGIVQLDIAAYIVALPTSVRVTTAIANLTHVARLLVFPLDLSPEYGPAVITPAGLGDPRFWLGAGVALLAIGIAVVGLRRGREWLWITWGVAWVAVGFALVSNLVLPLPMWIAERTLYLPSVGLSLILVGVLAATRRRRVGHTAVALVCLAGAAHTWSHQGVWADDEALFSDLVERHPESFRGQWWLGGRMVDGGDVEGGLVWLERAVETSPNSALLTLDYARALLLVGRSVEAEALVRPVPPRAHPSRSVFLAQSLIFQERPGGAAEVVREGLELFPGDPRLMEQARLLGIGG